MKHVGQLSLDEKTMLTRTSVQVAPGVTQMALRFIDVATGAFEDIVLSEAFTRLQVIQVQS